MQLVNVERWYAGRNFFSPRDMFTTTMATIHSTVLRFCKSLGTCSTTHTDCRLFSSRFLCTLLWLSIFQGSFITHASLIDRVAICMKSWREKYHTTSDIYARRCYLKPIRRLLRIVAICSVAWSSHGTVHNLGTSFQRKNLQPVSIILTVRNTIHVIQICSKRGRLSI